MCRHRVVFKDHSLEAMQEQQGHSTETTHFSVGISNLQSTAGLRGVTWEAILKGVLLSLAPSYRVSERGEVATAGAARSTLCGLPVTHPSLYPRCGI